MHRQQNELQILRDADFGMIRPKGNIWQESLNKNFTQFKRKFHLLGIRPYRGPRCPMKTHSKMTKRLQKEGNFFCLLESNRRRKKSFTEYFISISPCKLRRYSSLLNTSFLYKLTVPCLLRASPAFSVSFWTYLRYGIKDPNECQAFLRDDSDHSPGLIFWPEVKAIENVENSPTEAFLNVRESNTD